MARTQINKLELKVMSDRLFEIVSKDLNLSLKELSIKLGYKNQSPLTKVKNGESFLGPDKIKELALLQNENGDTPNIAYIFTGNGDRMLSKKNSKHESFHNIGKQLVMKLGIEKSKMLLNVISG